jgi:hypothetical protein
MGCAFLIQNVTVHLKLRRAFAYAGYTDEQLFNCDETALSYESSDLKKTPSRAGVKTNKQTKVDFIAVCQKGLRSNRFASVKVDVPTFQSRKHEIPTCDRQKIFLCLNEMRHFLPPDLKISLRRQ